MDVEEAYENAVNLSGKKHASVSFSCGGMSFTVKPHRLGKKIAQLEAENDRLRQRLHDLEESMRREAVRMRSDPTYWASGL
jgi:hypothetical protein